MSINKEINQLIEYTKQNITNYQSQLNSIETESESEKELLLKAIEIEEAEIKSLLTQYRDLKQKQEIEVIRNSFASLTDFKQILMQKMQQEADTSQTTEVTLSLEQKISEFENLSGSSNNGSAATEDLPKKLDNSILAREISIESANVSLAVKEKPEELEGIEALQELKVAQELEVADETETLEAPQELEVEDETETLEAPQELEVEDETETLEAPDDISKVIESIDQIDYQRLVKLYPHNLTQIIPGFDIKNTELRDSLLQYYLVNNSNIHNALVKLYQKPEKKYQGIVPNSRKLSQRDRKVHDFILVNYPNALPLFWHLVNREPESIKYVVMECAKDHIICTNEIDPNNNPNLLKIGFNELLSLNNGSSFEGYLRDLFVCFHPRKLSSNKNATNKYFNYFDRLIHEKATLEHSKILKFWTQMKHLGYKTVAADDFPIKDSD